MARDESVMAAIEMAAERPTGALRGVCTHVRLSPFAWRRQGMPPECRQRHTSAGPLIFARTAGRYEGYWQDTAATAATARWASIEDWLVPCLAALRGEKPALSEIFLQQLIGIIHGTIRIDVSGGGGRYAGHSSLREIPNTLLITSESRAASPLS